MNNEIVNLVKTIKEEIEEMDIVLNNEDRRKLDKVMYMDNIDKAIEEINMLLDNYFYQKFLEHDNYNYYVEQCNYYTNDITTAYQIGNGLIGYELNATGERFVSERDIDDRLEDLEEE